MSFTSILSNPADHFAPLLCSSIIMMLNLCACILLSLSFWPRTTILDPSPGMKPVPSAVKAWSPKHWTFREFPLFLLLMRK